MNAIPNPDRVWRDETMAQIIARQSEQHSAHRDAFADFERRFEAFGARIDEVEALR